MRIVLPVIASSAVGAVTILVLRGIQPDGAEPNQRTPAYTRAFGALCESSELAERGDLRRAQGVFVSRSHLALHELAAEASDVDRSVAAALLEAKAEVEATLPLKDSDSPRALDDLIAATAAAMQTVTDAAAPTCQEAAP